MGTVYCCEICDRKATLCYQLYIHCSINEDVPEQLLFWCDIRFFHEDGKGSNSLVYRCESHCLDEDSLPDQSEGFMHM